VHSSTHLVAADAEWSSLRDRVAGLHVDASEHAVVEPKPRRSVG
jgi:hypothetical protein